MREVEAIFIMALCFIRGVDRGIKQESQSGGVHFELLILDKLGHHILVGIVIEVVASNLGSDLRVSSTKLGFDGVASIFVWISNGRSGFETA